MSITPEMAGFALTLMTIGGAIWGASRKFAHLEGRVGSMEKEFKNDEGLREKIDERLDKRLSSLDNRVQSVESKVVGVEVKIDAIKESITDLKKLVMGKGSSN
jgi:peptidoglycan hydrolase CwlO-like protein